MKLFTAHWELKLLSLLAAALLWGFVVGGEKSEVVLTVPVEFSGIPSGLELAAEYPDSVDVLLRGLRRQLARARGETLRVRVHLASARAGETTVRLLPEQVRVPTGVQVVRITPSRLRVLLDALESATVKVVPQLRGAPPAGFVLKEVTVSPAAVEVRGPRSEVKRLTQVETEPIDLSTVRAPRRISVLLAGPGGSVRLVGDRTAEVTLEVSERGS